MRALVNSNSDCAIAIVFTFNRLNDTITCKNSESIFIGCQTGRFVDNYVLLPVGNCTG